MNPFDLPGPTFLALYVVVLGAALAAAGWLRSSLRGPDDGVAVLETARLDPYEVAYLAGGPAQAGDAAVASLYRRGVLDVSGDGSAVFVQADLRADGVHPVERATYDLIATRSARETMSALGRRAAELPEFLRLRERLQDRGLLLTPEDAFRLRAYPAAFLLAVALIGGIKIAVGLSRQKPVEILSILCGVALITALGFACASAERTRRADSLLEVMRLRRCALLASARCGVSTLEAQDIALAVALYGLTTLRGGPMNPLVRVVHPPSSSGSYFATGGSSCSSGVGDSGGDSGGGGGCGGCGGGGGD
jgi:uncharacterized protein (TIGR04222 family)